MFLMWHFKVSKSQHLYQKGKTYLSKIAGIEMLRHVNVKCCARDFMETNSQHLDENLVLARLPFYSGLVLGRDERKVRLDNI